MKYLDLYQQGFVMKVKHLKLPEVSPRPTVKRGYITEFSAKSRKRLIELFASLDQGIMKFSRERIKFITLTYKDYVDPELSKVHLKRFMERLQYAHPEMWCVWRIELQERGVIHYHLIVGNVPYTDRNWLQFAWSECSDQIDPSEVNFVESVESLARRCAFTRIEAIKSVRGVLSYAAKYMTKTSDSFSLGLTMCHTFGRHWGVYGRRYMPFAVMRRTRIALTNNLYNWFLYVCNNPYCQTDQSFTLLQENAFSLWNVAMALFKSEDFLNGMLDLFNEQWQRVASHQLRDTCHLIKLRIDDKRFNEWLQSEIDLMNATHRS